MGRHPFAHRLMVEAKMGRRLLRATLAAATMLNGTLFERNAMPGHAKPPKLDVQLSGVSSFGPGQNRAAKSPRAVVVD